MRWTDAAGHAWRRVGPPMGRPEVTFRDEQLRTRKTTNHKPDVTIARETDIFLKVSLGRGPRDGLVGDCDGG
jgi:hypothetical protein